MTSERSLDPSSADIASANASTSELAGRIRDLERTIERCEQQLQVRAAVIRRLRRELQNAHASHNRLVASRTYKAANTLRRVALVARPRVLLAATRERLARARR
jgi:chromosome segregation ATPase